MNIKTLLNGVPNFPPHVEIETTNFCNLKSLNCPSKDMRRAKGIMDFELYKKIINEIAENKPKGISLHVFGEPLMNPGISDFISYAHDNCNGTKVSMSTNTTLLKGKMVDKLVYSGLADLTSSVGLKGIKPSAGFFGWRRRRKHGR
jgi:MoaA/NifB/PqqE/SkfB family radical SAM enzyme